MANANDLVFNANIIVQEEGTSSGNKSDGKKLNKGSGRAQNYKRIHDINFTSVAKLGLAIRGVRMANELVGAYSGERLTQRRMQAAMTFAQYGVGIAVAGGIGFVYAASDMAYRVAQERMEINKNNQIASYVRNLSGNNARNQSRHSGEKL
jgi:hypothetical protein